ncbi:hypothetical protein G7046_g5165 [Stylonectria norvegica]|nr:hypothetical protein G7046_g5165 [Stylonectria norvegica]
MATQDVATVPVAAPTTVLEEPSNSIGLDAIAVALGMNPATKNPLQKPDSNFLEEVAKVPVNMGDMPPGDDVHAMRKWIKEVFLGGALTEFREKCDMKLRRPKQEVKKDVVTIKTSDGAGSFDLWIYSLAAGGTEGKPKPAILMFHGGGWIHGDPSGDEGEYSPSSCQLQAQRSSLDIVAGIAKVFVSELDAVVMGVDYRLAPEHPFPTPLDDCSDALKWTFKNSVKYDIDTTRVALWGASAGGNLAAALALKYSKHQARSDRPALSFVSLAVPAVAHPTAQVLFDEKRDFQQSDNEALFADNPPLPEAVLKELRKLFELYTGGEIESCNPLASPLLATSTSFLHHPPTHVTVAACDALRVQGQAYAALLRHSGVCVTEEILPGVPHMFTLPMNAKVTRGWLEKQVDLFMEAFGI